MFGDIKVKIEKGLIHRRNTGNPGLHDITIENESMLIEFACSRNMRSHPFVSLTAGLTKEHRMMSSLRNELHIAPLTYADTTG